MGAKTDSAIALGLVLGVAAAVAGAATHPQAFEAAAEARRQRRLQDLEALEAAEVRLQVAEQKLRRLQVLPITWADRAQVNSLRWEVDHLREQVAAAKFRAARA